jgi:hypothetical protein
MELVEVGEANWQLGGLRGGQHCFVTQASGKGCQDLAWSLVADSEKLLV